MKSIFNSFVNKVKTTFVRKKEDFVNYAKDSKKAKKTAFFLTLMLFALSFGCFSSILAVSTLKINKTQTIAEKILNDNSAENSLGFIYGYETSADTFELCSARPELSKELRSINHNWELYDVYPRNFNGSTPATVNYLDKSNVDISFLLLPKENYTNSYFNEPYVFDLLCGQTNKKANIEDLYINQKYADYLLFENGLEKNDYQSLINLEIRLPYRNKYLSNDDVDVTYKIKGVMREDSKKYQKYSSFFGDFFLANQYLSLPLTNGMCFSINNTVNSLREQLDLIYKLYDYKTNGRSFDALSFTYKYDYRAVGIGMIGTQKSIDDIYNKDNALMDGYNSIYDYFFYKQYIIPFVCILVIDLILCFIYIWSFVNATRLIKGSYTITLILVCFSVISIFFALLFNLIPILHSILSIPLSVKSWQAFVIMISQSILLALISVLIKVRLGKKLQFERDINKRV